MTGQRLRGAKCSRLLVLIPEVRLLSSRVAMSAPWSMRLTLAVQVVLLSAVLFAGTASAAGARTLVANCGGLGYLAQRPEYWSAGCTAGSPTIIPIEWTAYGRRTATGQGQALVQDCGCATPTYTESYSATVVLSKPKHCHAGPRLKYLSKANITIAYSPENLFGVAAGESSQIFKTLAGTCARSP